MWFDAGVEKVSVEPTHKLKQGSFNGKPKATFPLSFDKTVAFGLPLNEFMRPLCKVFRPNLVDSGKAVLAHDTARGNAVNDLAAGGIARNPAFRSISRFNVRREGAFKRELQPTELLYGVAGYGTLCGRY